MTTAIYGCELSNTFGINTTSTSTFYQVIFNNTTTSTGLTYSGNNMVIGATGGVVRITGSISITGGNNGDKIVIAIYQNGVAIASASTLYSAGLAGTIVVDIVASCNSGDTFGLWIADQTTNAFLFAQNVTLVVESIGGVQGPTGPAGGPVGATGSIGPQGSPGVTGTAGAMGATGAIGPMGPQGVTGPAGGGGGISGVSNLSGDATGLADSTLVIGIQGHSISNSIPSGSSSLIYNTSTSSWTPLPNTFNVRAFGAKGDGITDDTVAIQAAFAAIQGTYVRVVDGNETVAGGGTVFFPPGLYVVSSTINIPLDPINGQYQNVIIAGAGFDATYIKATGFFIVFNSEGRLNAQTRSNIEMRDLTIGGVAGYFDNPAQWTPNTVYTPGQNVSTVISNRIMTCLIGGTSAVRRSYGVLAGNVAQPQVSFSGTPLDLWPQVVLTMATSGSNTTATFNISLDGGASNAIGPLTASAATVIPNTGLTAHFGTDHSNSYTAGTVYCTPPFGAGFSTVHDTTLTDGSVTWAVVDGGCGFLNQTGGNIHIKNCHFVNLIVGIIFDGTEVSVIEDCNFECYNGVWITGGNARLNNGLLDPVASSDQANVVEIYRGNMASAGVNFAVEYCDNFKITDTNFENGVWYGWISGVDLVSIDNLSTEGGGVCNLTPYAGGGLFVGAQGPFNGGLYLYSSNVYIKESLIDSAFAPCIVGRQNALTTTNITGPWVNLTIDNCQVTRNGGVSGVSATGTSPPDVQIMMSQSSVQPLMPTGYNFLLDITTGGAVGTALFKWSQNGGTTWQATGVNTSPAVGLTGTNLTAYFSSVGTYVNNNIYNCVSTPNAGMPNVVGADQGNGLRIIDPSTAFYFDVIPEMYYSDSKVNAAGMLGLGVQPNAMLDISGSMALRAQPNSVYYLGYINSESVNIDLQWEFVHIMLWGFNDTPGTFSIAGVIAGTEGREITIFNPLGQTMIIKDEYSGESTLINRIRTGLGYDLVIPSVSGNVNWVKIAYCSTGTTFGASNTTARWVVIGSSLGTNSPISHSSQTLYTSNATGFSTSINSSISSSQSLSLTFDCIANSPTGMLVGMACPTGWMFAGSILGISTGHNTQGEVLVASPTGIGKLSYANGATGPIHITGQVIQISTGVLGTVTPMFATIANGATAAIQYPTINTVASN